MKDLLEVRDKFFCAPYRKLQNYAYTMNVIHNQDEFNEAITDDGTLKGDWAIMPIFPNNIVNMRKLRKVTGSLYIGGMGLVLFPYSDVEIQGSLLCCGECNLDIYLGNSPYSILLFEQVGNVNITLSNSCHHLTNLDVAWAPKECKYTIYGVQTIDRASLAFNRGEVKLPDVRFIDDMSLQLNFSYLDLPVMETNFLNIEGNASGVKLRELERVNEYLRVVRNRDREPREYRPRGAYVDLAVLKSVKILRCYGNDFINLPRLENVDDSFVFKNARVYSNFVKDYFETSKSALKERAAANSIRDFYENMMK